MSQLCKMYCQSMLLNQALSSVSYLAYANLIIQCKKKDVVLCGTVFAAACFSSKLESNSQFWNRCLIHYLYILIAKILFFILWNVHCVLFCKHAKFTTSKAYFLIPEHLEEEKVTLNESSCLLKGYVVWKNVYNACCKVGFLLHIENFITIS